MDNQEILQLAKVTSEANRIREAVDQLKEVSDSKEMNEHIDELEGLLGDITEHVTEGQKKLAKDLSDNQLTLSDIRDNMLRQLIEAKKAAELAGNGKAVVLVNGLIKQHKMAKSLDFLLTGSNRRVDKIKRKEYTELLRKVREKLGNNKKYTFADIRGLNEGIQRALPEGYKEYSMAFLMRFYSYIVKSPIESNAIMISQVINNLRAMATTDPTYHGEFKLRVMHVIDNITGKWQG